jgi:hypothetical protein
MASSHFYVWILPKLDKWLVASAKQISTTDRVMVASSHHHQGDADDLSLLHSMVELKKRIAALEF